MAYDPQNVYRQELENNDVEVAVYFRSSPNEFPLWAFFDPFKTVWTTLIGAMVGQQQACSDSTVASITYHQDLRVLKRYTHIKPDTLVTRWSICCMPRLLDVRHSTRTVKLPAFLRAVPS